MRRRFGTVAVVSIVIVLSMACSGSSTPPQASTSATRSAPAAAQGESPWQKTALWVEQGGQTQPFENGKSVVVGDVTVEVFVAPYPPSREGSIDLYLTDKATGKPLEDSGIGINFDMYMPHGQIKTEALSTGNGHYLVPYKLVMPGEWRMETSISRNRTMGTLAIIFRVD